MRILSLGAGVQSTTLFLMAAKGEFGDKPDYAIFADTQDEPSSIYKYLEWLDSLRLIPILKVTKGKLSDSVLHISKRFISIPSFGDRGGMSRRQCTVEFKITPIQKKCRELLKAKPFQRLPKNSIEMWIGISLDEVQRMKHNRQSWITNRWPLIEKRMTRHDCLEWLKKNNFPLPEKSACVYCPYHNNATWRKMKLDNSPEWIEAVRVDHELNKRGEYLHRTLQPLNEIDFRNDIDKGQQTFEEECEGICGV